MKYLRTFVLAMLFLVLFGIGLIVVMLPLWLAGTSNNEAWLLLWIPVFGALVALVQWTRDHGS